MATPTLAEDRIFDLARHLLEDFIAGREEYEHRLALGFFTTSGSHMRRHLNTLSRNESAVQMFYFQ
jgi:hypothetical protein